MLDRFQQEFLKALEENMGIVSLTLDQTKTSRLEYNEWMEEVMFKLKVEEIAERCLDIVEKRLLEEIDGGNLQAIQFYLKTKGRNRGYV